MLPGSCMMAALQHREPDRVPIGELAVDPLLEARLQGWAGSSAEVTRAVTLLVMEYRPLLFTLL